ncbi:uncharacterized protein Z518_09546 [Rhinocladiella mackenziei CBS 650.93]|uniref:Restriction of telomere capping protein 4 n=1 Tax=Rhinocladiella mackenziei CBS 650.93 TaxID=1442369 RepID=A0A0D2I7J1_9EURO|nr:uncharacterized protein Z518_09546 [Rhinocladiella mackenziei CBS 650.93]KIX01819.1 hypothetical protein Z518_09546 [Rhinocladiella mackenziei CBS 650.93]
MKKFNASYSKTYLTRHNYYGPNLLKTIRGRRTDTASGPALGEDLKRKSPNMKPRMEEDDELAIYAQPMSSDEDFIVPKETAKRSPRKLKTETMKPSRASPKRPANTAASTRSKRRKLQDEPSIDNVITPGKDEVGDTFPSWNVGSQKRKLQKNYANRKFFVKPEIVESKDDLRGSKQEFISHDVVEKREDVNSKTGFQEISALPRKRATRSLSHSKPSLDIADLPQKGSPSKESDFFMPDLPDFDSSAPTTGTDNPSTFSEEFSPDKPGHNRSGSTSSLSSVDSMFLLENKLEMDAMGDPEVTGQICPICKRPVKDSVLLFVPNNLRKISFQKQQNFCSQHQLVDAKEQWKERGYPEINWEDLEENRIRKKIPNLKQIINRETPSFYRDHLDTRIEAAKGHGKAIRTYLNQGIIDVVKQGYYGPKGTQIMINAITESLSGSLNKALQSDSTLRTAGVGYFVSAVLVPELTLQLVMEDMKLSRKEDGRAVMDESTHIGILLNPDDDRVERGGEGEDEDGN